MPWYPPRTILAILSWVEGFQCSARSIHDGAIGKCIRGLRGRLCWTVQPSIEWNLFHINTMQSGGEDLSTFWDEHWPLQCIVVHRLHSTWLPLRCTRSPLTRVSCTGLRYSAGFCRKWPVQEMLIGHRSASHYIAIHRTISQRAEEDDQRYKCKLKFSLRWLMMPCCNGV